MSSTETLASVALSAQELLVVNEDKLVQLLNDSRTKSGGFDISRVVGVDGLSKDQREAFSVKLSAAAVKDGSLNTNELSRLLEIFAGQDRTAHPLRIIVALKPSATINSSKLHKWQWDNRGEFASNEGFTTFSESQRKRWLHKEEFELVSDPSFEATTRHIWDYEQRFLETSGRESFAAYAQAVERRLASHHFTQPVQLAEDPRKQDARTTWVEYLSYVYWWLDRHAAAIKTAEPQYREAWDELQRFETSPLLSTPTTTRVPDEELGTTKAQLEAARQQIHKFIKDTKKYRRCERAVRRYELRAQWVLEQLSLIDATPFAENKTPKESSNANRSRKRKARDNTDAPTRQQPKRRRQQAGHGDSAPNSRSGAGKGADVTTHIETAANSTTAGPERRRSQRLRAGVVAAMTLSSQPQPKAQGKQKRHRQRGPQSLGSTSPQTSRTRKPGAQK
ncbi:hypothetical protein GJ744_003928 [Endocarpon pusillum]|uniref:Uncharacterized protein n=1 Tax=Endocarpon pusillum TaxID=364733 RepID=A0A8H7DXW0_9EURO|nr:hypothetical protein GJ744_003928 [Endocarpon pusillum]